MTMLARWNPSDPNALLALMHLRFEFAFQLCPEHKEGTHGYGTTLLRLTSKSLTLCWIYNFAGGVP